MDQVPVSGLKVKEPDSSHIQHSLFFYYDFLDMCVCFNSKLEEITYLTFIVTSDVGSWREGGGRNLNTGSGPDMENRAPEEGGPALGTSTPPVEADDSGKNATTDGQREKRDARERAPLSGPPPPKQLNGGQQPPAGVPTHFDPAFRSMMPSYVSHMSWLERRFKL